MGLLHAGISLFCRSGRASFASLLDVIMEEGQEDMLNEYHDDCSIHEGTTVL